jgi:hypothetical protein
MTKRAAAQTGISKPKTKRTRASKPPALLSEPTHEQIERRAFELYLARGASDGNALGDWLRAEAELRSHA